ncbi:MAG: plasmid mobilization relaxosome protein MobC [Bacteroidetes bacterium]|nr:plasmid mobilization relaxosome protein MobC [Bacteroidota bacterium]
MEQENKNTWLNIRLSVDEKNRLKKELKGTTCRKLSELARNKLLTKPITYYTRDQSLDDFMAALQLLLRELNAVGNNFNQAVKKLNAMPVDGNVRQWILLYEKDKDRLLELVASIHVHIKIFAEQWLQNLKRDHH